MAEVPSRLIEALADRYAIQGEIGAGGMATVYRARDLRHRRLVAVKVLRPDLAEYLGPDRFLREIEIAAALTHPHILPLHDSGEADGFLYYVMPFIEGESLRERLAKDGALSIPEAVRNFREVVDALGEAHRRGVVHRDIKPANVLLSGGHALVADFGVARAVREATGVHKLTTAGVAIGTPQYMAPEQASADPAADHRADIFAAGAIAYEMLTGISPFGAPSAAAVFAAVMMKSPEPPHRLRAAVPESLGELVMDCLAKSPDERPQSATELMGRLDSIMTPATGVTRAAGGATDRGTGRRATPVRVATALVLLAVVSVGIWELRSRQARRSWARAEAIPEVIRLVGENRLREAAELGLEVQRVLGADPIMEPLWPRMSTPFRVVTDPPGADVWYRPYEVEGERWHHLGQSPYSTERFPVGAFRFRIERNGYETHDEARSFIPANLMALLRNAGFDYLTDPSYVINARLTPTGSESDGMIAVAGGPYGLLPISGFGTLAPLEIPEFKIDRTEVTNRDYQEFVAAGGYAAPSFWPEPFRTDDEILSWADAMAILQDGTGRPGPATWALGRPPEGQAAHPVGGVSWFEATAYCSWRGKRLPTLFHWTRAALPSSDVWVPFNPILAAAANLEAEGPEAVGSRDAIAISGAQDMAGNLREWTSTASGSRRYLVGGAWSDPAYALHDQTVASPWVRFPTDGFRCASYLGGNPPEALMRSLDYPPQDLYRDASIPDDVFEAMRARHTYDATQPLAARVDSSFVLDWGATVEWISVDAPYRDRLPIRLFLPPASEGPFQAVVYFPGGNLLRSTQMEAPALEFLVRSGRAVVEPVYEGTFQRNDGRTVERMAGQSSRSELVAHWVQDLGRTLDYLEARPDIDGGRTAYVGLSLGASLTPILLPYEPRFKAAILFSGGFPMREAQEGVDRRIGLARRVRVPVLMLGGRYDFANPIRHQEALFHALGAPDADKRIRIFEAGHSPLPLNDVLRETVDFLDRYLGPAGGADG